MEAVLKLREEYPHWGRDKPVVLLDDGGLKGIYLNGGLELEAVFGAEYHGICFAAILAPLVYSCGAHPNSTVALSELTGLTLRNELSEWERIFDTVRLHQALGYVTPLKLLERWKEN